MEGQVACVAAEQVPRAFAHLEDGGRGRKGGGREGQRGVVQFNFPAFLVFRL